MASAAYCGWSRGQLENEVRQGSWQIFNRSADVVFDPDPKSLWRRLIARVEQNVASRMILTFHPFIF